MRNITSTFAKLAVSSLLPLAMIACSSEPEISYAQDVKPVLDKNCLECHQENGAGTLASGFDMSSFDGLMKGTHHGPMVIPGDPEGSNLIVLIEGRADPSISMPHGKDSISDTDIQMIRSWVSQGAKNN